MIEAEPDSDSVDVSPGELEALALDVISHDDAPRHEAAEGSRDEPITSCCDRAPLDVSARLRLFRKACRAVHDAHQRGTIFGDLRPERLRTTADGAVVTVDVGAGPLPGPTAVGPWTSPEQVLGEPAVMASDVYALGVVLYELLTGRHPYQVDLNDPEALAKAISDQSAERPSEAVARAGGRPDEAESGTPPDAALARATTPRALRAALAGDLDAITLKALHKEPERRYASADALAEDLDRFARGLPVQAHAPSELYRVGKFLRRRPWVGVAGVALVAAVGIAGALGYRALEAARRERDQAERLYRSARMSVQDVYTRLAEDRPRDSEDVAGLRRDVLGRVTRYYEDFIAAHRDEPDRLADVAEARTRTAMIARTIGQKNAAEAKWREAIDLWGRLAVANPEEAGFSEQLARAQAELGRSLDAEGGADSRPDEALAAFERARGLLSPLADAHLDARPLRRELARVLRDEAAVHDRQDRPAPASDLLRQSVRLQEELGWEVPRDLDARLDLASAYGFMARMDARRESGRRGARAALERAVELLGEAPEAADPPPRLAFETAQRLIDLANIERTLDATSEAAGHALRAVAILETLAARLPTEPAYQLELAAAYNVVGEVRRSDGAFASAIEAAGKAQGVLERLLREHPGNPSHSIELATTHQLIGRALAQSGKYPEALQSFRLAVDLLEGRPELDAAGRYNLAVTLSLALSLVGAKDGSPPPEDEEALGPADKLRRRLYGDRAVAVLRQAVAGGFKSLDVYRTDPALDPLRSREDFQKLIADLAASETR